MISTLKNDVQWLDGTEVRIYNVEFALWVLAHYWEHVFLFCCKPRPQSLRETHTRAHKSPMNTGYKVMHFLLVLMTTPGSAAKQRQRDCRQMYTQVHRHRDINNGLLFISHGRISWYVDAPPIIVLYFSLPENSSALEEFGDKCSQ